MQLSNALKRCASLLLAACLIVILLINVNARFVSANAGLSESKPKFLGNIISSDVPTNFNGYWNQITPENSTKWGHVEAVRGQMNWSQADKAYNYARSNGLPFKFHTLVWGSQEPGWISFITTAEQEAEVLQWMDAAATKYGDSDYVDVVNEALHAPASYRNALGGSGATDWDWVIRSFEEARKRFNGKLLINDYGIISDTNKVNRYLQIINLLKERNLIDGIGIQCHYFNVDNLQASTIKVNLDKLSSAGLPIYVSELDITGDDNTQLERYKEKFPVFWEHPYVNGVTIWGWIQGETWKNGTHLVTSLGEERPALKWLREYVDANPRIYRQSSSLVKFPVLYESGDVNRDGIINSADYVLMKRYLLDNASLSGDRLPNADMDGDGIINSADYALLRRYILGQGF